MTTINLKDFYYWYLTDEPLVVSEGEALCTLKTAYFCVSMRLSYRPENNDKKGCIDYE